MLATIYLLLAIVVLAYIKDEEAEAHSDVIHFDMRKNLGD